ncbi:hypothetical protein HQ560_04335, partial [bacterium]|nr:hypothetical protein [bacterium]
MNRLHAAFLIALTGTLASAGSLAPALFARNRSFGDGKLLRLPITRVHIDARIVGRVAETTLTLTFSNPHDRELEGELYFPLPEGVTVSGYALDIRGTMVDGVAVAKRKARQVYEAIVAQKIDPGLVEWVKANTFRTRVYPLPAHGARTVSISTVAELANKGEGMAYRLPLAFPEAIADVSVRVRVDAATAPPRVTGGATANMVVGKASHGYVVYAMERDIALDHDLVVVVPDAAKGQVVAETAPDGDVYFCITDTARDPRPAGNKESRARPRRIAVLWDASRSREKVDHEKEFALIERYVASLGAGKLLADLVVFRDSAEKARRFRLDDGTAKPLIAALQTVVYDGGTQLGRLAAPGADVVLLFTDGLATYGAASPPVFRVPVYAFNVASVADPAAVRRLAHASGGEFFDLTVTAPDAAVAGMGETPFQFLGAKTEGVAAEDSFPRTVERVQGRFAFTGRLRGDSATVTLTYGANGKPLAKTTHVVRRADAAPGTLLARLWAQEKVAHLLGTDEGSQAAVEDVGKRYGIVTPYTSLIVLESLEQYIQYGIEPPRTLPGMREAYAAAVGRRGSRAKKNEADRLAEVAALWRARVSWWEREFPQAADFRHRGRHVTDHDEREEPWGEEREENLDHWGEEDDDAPRDTLDEDFFGDEDDDGTPESVEYGGGRRRTALAADGGYSSVGSRTATTALGEDFFGDEDGDDAANAPPEAGQVVDGADKAEPVITIKQWDPNVPYLAALKKAAPGDMYRAYLAQRTEHGASPGYYVDCADALFAAK